MSAINRLKHAWNAFINPTVSPNEPMEGMGYSYFGRPDRLKMSFSSERSIVSSIYTRIGIDVASVDIKHVRLDEDHRFKSEIPSYLNECLSLDPNLDQTARSFRQDAVMTMLETGVAAIVPVETTSNPRFSNSYDIKNLRVGTILDWYPKHVRVKLYNENKGMTEDIMLAKSMVAIVENPLYSVMNEPNSTLQRLIHKLSLLDVTDQNNSSGKLDLILQLPYVVKSETRREQAERRRKDIEFQLTSSQYGIAYTDGTERITQLNRAVENTMLEQIKYLTGLVYNQLGLTEQIFNGTADEEAMLNYFNRTIEPILTSITEAMTKSFLTKTARTQGQTITFFRDPFKLVAVSDIADIADKFTRNEILSSNEVRDIIGRKPSDDPEADALRNKNMPKMDDGELGEDEDFDEEMDEDFDEDDSSDEMSQIVDEVFDEIEAALNEILSDLGVDDEELEEDEELAHSEEPFEGFNDIFSDIDSIFDEALSELGGD